MCGLKKAAALMAEVSARDEFSVSFPSQPPAPAVVHRLGVPGDRELTRELSPLWCTDLKFRVPAVTPKSVGRIR